MKKKKIYAIEATILIIGTIFASASSEVIQTNALTCRNIQPIAEEDLTDITVGISTPNGIKEITKTITSKEANHLSELMQKTQRAFEILENYDTKSSERFEANRIIDETIFEMKRLGLIPTTINDDEVKNIMNGSYGRKLFNKVSKKINQIIVGSEINQENNYYNYLSTVRSFGSGVFLFIPDIIFWGFIFDNDFWNEDKWFVHLLKPIAKLITEISFLNDNLKIVIPFAIGYLSEDIWNNPCGTKTSGLIGKWKISDNHKLVLLGAVGLYMGIFHSEGGFLISFCGFSSYVSASKETLGIDDLNISINGPNKGKIDKIGEYSININSSNGNQVYCKVDWGDGSDTGWLGPFETNEKITISHKWSKVGNYIISGELFDSNLSCGNIIDEIEVEISKSKSNNKNFCILNKILEQLRFGFFLK